MNWPIANVSPAVNTAVFPAVFTAGLTFAIGQFTVSNYVGPELTDTLAALCSLASVALLLKFWSPTDGYVDGRPSVVETVVDPGSRVARAYATYGILIVTVLIGQVGNFAGMSQLQPPARDDSVLYNRRIARAAPIE